MRHFSHVSVRNGTHVEPSQVPLTVSFWFLWWTWYWFTQLWCNEPLKLVVVDLTHNFSYLNKMFIVWIPWHPIDHMWTMMIVCRLGAKIIRTVLCCILYDSCAQWYAHTCEQFLNLHVGLGLDFVLVCLFRFNILCVFCVSVDHFIPVLLAFVVFVRGSVYVISVMPCCC